MPLPSLTDFLPSYFSVEKERRASQTSDSDVCEVPIAIGRVVCSARLDFLATFFIKQIIA
jgi:hypothetical protein